MGVRHIFAFLCVMGMVCLVQSMGYFGSSQLITFDTAETPSPKCITASPAGIIYMIWANGNTTYWVIFDTSLNYTSKNISVDVSGDAIFSCKYHNNRIYAVGSAGYAAVLAPTGQVLAQRTGTEDFETFVFSSEVVDSYASIYAWNSSGDVGTRVYYVSFSNDTAEAKDLDGLTPLGGFAAGGFIYFYGKTGITKFTDPGIALVNKIELPISTATFSPDGTLAFLFSENGECGMNVTIVSLDSLSVNSSFTLTPSGVESSICGWSKGITKAFAFNATVYIYVASNNTIYKIEDSKIVDALSASTNATSLAIDLMITNAFAGYAERRVHKYFAGTCAAREYFNASTGACAACDAGSWPSTAFSAVSCTACPAGTYWSTTGCQECPKGKFTNSSGMLECITCNAGYTINADASACEPCAVGFFSQNGQNCTACPAGSGSSQGASECIFCPPGSFSSEAGQECTLCEPGTSTNGTAGNQRCYTCADREIAADSGQSECSECPKNYYSDKTSTSCLSCSKDKWNRSGKCTPIGEIALLIPIVVLVGSGIGFVIWKTRKVGNNFKHYEMRDEVDPHELAEER